MEILACPICKNPDLTLIIFEENKLEVKSGIIHCTNCARYYPIRSTIPIMLPDDLRKEKEDLEFLRKFESQIPSEILTSGKPFNLAA